MPPKRFFTKNKERVGKKSGKPRGKYKKHGKIIEEEKIVLQTEESLVAPKQELPSIYRKITETVKKITIAPPKRFSWKMIGFFAFFLLIVGLSVWQAVVAVEKLAYLRGVVASRVKLTQEMNLWQGIAAKYPTYRDAYFQAAVLAYQLGDMGKEKSYLGKALEIDPNYEPAKNLEKISQ